MDLLDRLPLIRAIAPGHGHSPQAQRLLLALGMRLNQLWGCPAIYERPG